MDYKKVVAQAIQDSLYKKIPGLDEEGDEEDEADRLEKTDAIKPKSWLELTSILREHFRVEESNAASTKKKKNISKPLQI